MIPRANLFYKQSTDVAVSSTHRGDACARLPCFFTIHMQVCKMHAQGCLPCFFTIHMQVCKITGYGKVSQAQQCLSLACCKCCSVVKHTGTLKGPKPDPEAPMGSSKGSANAFNTLRPPKSPTATTSFIGTSRPLLPQNTTTLPFRQVPGAKGKDLHSTQSHPQTDCTVVTIQGCWWSDCKAPQRSVNYTQVDICLPGIHGTLYPLVVHGTIWRRQQLREVASFCQRPYGIQLVAEQS